jgi:tRNA (guanine37-N1)-methyltransferase
VTSRSPQAEKHLWVALVHHPVLNREGRIVTTAITNLDVHDIARAARTFGLRGYFLVTPIETQRALAERIIDHWRHGHGATRVPERGDALSLARTASSLARAIAVIEHEGGVRPRIVATTARPARSTVTFDELAARIAHGESTLLVLGTGWGLADEVFDAVDDVLGPIEGVDGGYNHLSVRCAAAIMMDRLIGRGS